MISIGPNFSIDASGRLSPRITREILISNGAIQEDVVLDENTILGYVENAGFLSFQNFPVATTEVYGLVALGNTLRRGQSGFEVNVDALSDITNDNILDNAALDFNILDISKEDIVALGIISEDTTRNISDIFQYVRNGLRI